MPWSISRDEPAVGEWTLRVLDRINPLKNGTLTAWELVLWGESIDAAKAVPYTLPNSLPETDEDEDEAPSSTITSAIPGTITKSFPKPTEHLPDDHVSAPGETHEPGLGNPALPSDATLVPISSPTAGSPITGGGTADEGKGDGFDTLSSGSWIFGAAGFVALAGLSGAGFFFYRRYRRSGSSGFGGGDGGDGGYGAVPGEEGDMAMGMLSGRRKRGGAGAGGPRPAGTKELYDAFGDASEEEDDFSGDEGKALGYHE